jgi:hypothetical protein
MNKLHRSTVEFALQRTFIKPKRELKKLIIFMDCGKLSILCNLHIYVAL